MISWHFSCHYYMAKLRGVQAGNRSVIGAAKFDGVAKRHFLTQRRKDAKSPQQMGD
jgi:hypothetical protein